VDGPDVNPRARDGTCVVSFMFPQLYHRRNMPRCGLDGRLVGLQAICMCWRGEFRGFVPAVTERVRKMLQPHEDTEFCSFFKRPTLF
jgi:hypothetical protein